MTRGKAIGCFAALLLAGIAAYAIFSGRLLQWSVRTAETWVRDNTPYEFRVQRAHLSFLRGLSLDGLLVKEKDATTPLLSVDEIRLRPQWKSLLKRDIVIDRITMVRPRLSLSLPWSGETSRSGAASSSRRVLKEIRNFEIDDASVTLRQDGHAPLEFTSVAAEGNFDDDRLRLDSYAASMKNQSISGDADIVISEAPTFDVRFIAKKMNVGAVARQFTTVPDDIRLIYSGAGRVSGTVEKWQLQAKGNTANGTFSLDMNQSASGQAVTTRFQNIALNRLYVHSMIGSGTSASGELRARTGASWNSDTHVDGALRVEGLIVRGVRSSVALEGNVDLNGGRGQANLSAKGDALAGNVSGSFSTKAETLDVAFDVSAPQLSALRPLVPQIQEWQGALIASGTLSGPWKSPALSARVHATNVENNLLKGAMLQAEVQSPSIAGNYFVLNASATEVHWKTSVVPEWDLEHAQLSWSGSTSSAQIQAHAWFSNKTQVRGEGLLSHNGDEWRWKWSHLFYVFKDSETWSVQPGGSLAFSDAAGFSAQDARIVNEEGDLELHRFISNGDRLAIDIDADHFPLKASVSSSSKTVVVDGTLDGKISVDGTLTAPVGTFRVSFSSGTVGDVTVREFLMAGSADQSMLHVKQGRLVTSYVDEPALFNGSLPWDWVVSSAPDLPMDMALDFGPIDPAPWLRKIPKALADSGGSVKFNGKIIGRRRRLVVEGSLSASLPRLKMPQYGVDIFDVSLDIENRNQVFKIQKGSARIGKKGNLSISGESRLPKIQVVVSGKAIRFKIPKRLDFLGDADLTLDGTIDEPQLTGKVAVKHCVYEVAPKKKEEATPAGPWVSQQYGESFWKKTRLDVEAVWSNDVWYRESLSKIESQADIHVMKDHDSDNIYLTGSMTLLRGTYNEYGRDFVIKSGDLTFTGPPDLNPILQVEAEYKTVDTTVELQVSGTAKQPQIALTSTPPMTEQEILSLLATGISSIRGSDVNGASSSGVAPGAGLAAGVLSSYLTNQVRASGLNVLSLDVLRVTPTANGNVWTVGRYLGPKFFFSYSTNTKDSATKVLNGEYTLSPRWSLVGQTGSNTDDYLDIQFRVPWPRKKKNAPTAPVPPVPEKK